MTDSVDTQSPITPNPSSLDELRQLVHHRLCARENLLEDQFGMVETPIVRGGDRCGLQFLLQGPRSVRLTAVWTADKNEIFFYDAVGERYDKVSLTTRIAA